MTAVLNTAMILAAGRGERMRPLTDATPKPLLMAGKQRLIEWQITALVRAGVQRIVINHAWHGEQFLAQLGDGSRYGCKLLYSPENPALETAGGIAQALHTFDLIHSTTPLIVVSGDIYSDYDYRQLPTALGSHAAHLVLVDNPPYNPNGDMSLAHGMIAAAGTHTLTYGNIGVFRPSLFAQLPRQTPYKLFPWLYGCGSISGELYNGQWHNVGTPAQLDTLTQWLGS